MNPAQILNHDFTRAFRGYEPAEVDAFLEELARELDETQASLRAAQERLRDAGDVARLRSMERELTEAIVDARHQATELLARAQAREKEILEAAEAQRASIVARAEAETLELRAESERLQSQLEGSRAEAELYEQLRGELHDALGEFEERLRSALTAVAVRR